MAAEEKGYFSVTCPLNGVAESQSCATAPMSSSWFVDM